MHSVFVCSSDTDFFGFSADRSANAEKAEIKWSHTFLGRAELSRAARDELQLVTAAGKLKPGETLDALLPDNTQNMFSF